MVNKGVSNDGWSIVVYDSEIMEQRIFWRV